MSLSNPIKSPTIPKVHPPLTVPSPSPHVKISDPNFDKLTAAEKLNDPNYRELVYQTYPNELTCACESNPSISNSKCNSIESKIQKSGNFLVCRSGCERSCCSSVRQQVALFNQDNANKDDKVPPAPFMPTYCVGSCSGNDEDRRKRKASAYNGSYCDVVENRLRGGGGEGGEGRGEEGMYPQSGEVNRAMVRSFDDAWNGMNGCVVNRRLEGGGGGGGYEYMERYPINRTLGSPTRAQCYNQENLPRGYPRAKHMEQPQDSHLNTSHHRTSTNAFSSVTETFGTVAAGCCCPGKEILAKQRKRRNDEGCTRKPCPSVDCLIKSFKETQEFVESLGKVPGLAGLGLMDPAESPYFGRERLKELNSETMKPSATASSGITYPNPQCVGPCNPQMLKSTINGGGSLFPAGTPFTIAVPGRGGVVREAVPSMTEPGLKYGKLRRRDDKEKLKDFDAQNFAQPADTEATPCGESKCKAKRRKKSVSEAPPSLESTEDKKHVAHANMNGGGISRAMNKVKGGSKMRSGHRSSEAGPGGDRPGRIMKSTSGKGRKIRFVYSVGDTQSGYTCGHKNCIEERRRVPWNMGWLWNLNQTVGKLKPRVGWKPGAIARHISEILHEAKAKILLDHKSRPKSRSTASTRSRSRSAPSRGKRSKGHGTRRSVKKIITKREEEDEGPDPPPTLYIHRKDGTYYVTMYPIKQDNMDIPKLEEPMKPLQFKIAKNKDDASVATSSTASDMEIEFSPPAAVNRYRKKPNVVHVDTQVKQQEIIAALKNDDGTKKEKKKGKKGKK